MLASPSQCHSLGVPWPRSRLDWSNVHVGLGHESGTEFWHLGGQRGFGPLGGFGLSRIPAKPGHAACELDAFEGHTPKAKALKENRS